MAGELGKSEPSAERTSELVCGADASELRLVALNAYLPHFVRKPYDVLARYGGPGFADAVRDDLAEALWRRMAAEQGWPIPPADGPDAEAARATVREQVAPLLDATLHAEAAGWWGVEDPQRAARRARSLGRQLRIRGNCLAGLCEVWHPDERRVIEESACTQTYWHDGAGLLTMACTAPGAVAQTNRWVFRARGDGAKDVDFYSDKGVQHSRIRTGCGFLDLYVTHLHYGGEMSAVLSEAGGFGGPFVEALRRHGAAIDFAGPSDEERREVRRQQLAELASFVAETRAPDGVVLVVGDFNIDGYAGPPAGRDRRSATFGRYSDLADVLARARWDDVALRAGLGGEGTVVDLATGSDSSLRVDYVLLEQPAPAHAMDVTVSEVTVERLSDEEGPLSDHKALLVTLRCTSR